MSARVFARAPGGPVRALGDHLRDAWRERWRPRLPGIAVAAVLAWAAGALAGGLGDPLARNPLLIAVLLGLLIGNTFGCPAPLKPGLDYTKRLLLRFAVVLIGFRITLQLLVHLGAVPIAIAVTELACMWLIIYWAACKLFKLDRALALLLAAGTSVCGASAILSVASITRARPQQAAIAVTLITLFGTVALLGYPYALLEGWLPGFDDERYGILVGASVYEVPQVVGAAYAVSDYALYTATLVKLTKVLLLVPLLLGLAYWQRRTEQSKLSDETRAPAQARACLASSQPADPALRRDDAAAPRPTAPLPFPWFIVGFAAVLVFNSFITLPASVKGAIQSFDLFLFLMVMIAIGLDTRLARVRQEGGAARLLGLGALALVCSTALTLLLVSAAAQRAASAAVPPEWENAPPLATEGGRIFEATGCAKCHVPTLPAGEVRVTLYSDLLLHDMGPALDDKIVQGEATGRDWRTTPLVGLGLRTRYLHDGRAGTLRDAILAHGGEGEIVRDRFFALSEDEQHVLYRFLESL
jgi:uncharacterized integral membrane protein (TIGR00698 family)